MEMEADTGENFTVLKGVILRDVNWLQRNPTNAHIMGHNGIAKVCSGTFQVKINTKTKVSRRSSNKSTYNMAITKDDLM